MTVYKDIDFSKGLTEEQLAMLEKLADSPVVPDYDSPELTDEQMTKFIRATKK